MTAARTNSMMMCGMMMCNVSGSPPGELGD